MLTLDRSSSARYKNHTRQQSDVNAPLIGELTTMDIRTQMILKRCVCVCVCVFVGAYICVRVQRDRERE